MNKAQQDAIESQMNNLWKKSNRYEERQRAAEEAGNQETAARAEKCADKAYNLFMGAKEVLGLLGISVIYKVGEFCRIAD